jgi:hypothetical protein
VCVNSDDSGPEISAPPALEHLAKRAWKNDRPRTRRRAVLLNMVFGTCTLLLLSLAVYCSRAAQLLLNPNATIFDDINTITHDQVQRQIVIDLLHSRRCDSPTFIVRFSGTSLYLMDLEKHDYEPLVVKAAEQFFYPRKSVYTFTYPVLEDAGTYFIEVLVLFCTVRRFTDHGQPVQHQSSVGSHAVLTSATSAVQPIGTALGTQKSPYHPRTLFMLSRAAASRHYVLRRYASSQTGSAS